MQTNTQEWYYGSRAGWAGKSEEIAQALPEFGEDLQAKPIQRACEGGTSFDNAQFLTDADLPAYSYLQRRLRWQSTVAASGSSLCVICDAPCSWEPS